MDKNILYFVAKCMGQPESPETGKACAFCYNTTASVPYKNVVGGNTREQFYDNTKDFCPDCAFILNNKATRTKNWIVTKEEIVNPKHVEVWQYLFKELPFPNVICLTTTYKKHQFPYGEINYFGTTRKIVLDQKIIKYDIEKDKTIFDIVSKLYNLYKQPKKAILKRQYNTYQLTEEQYIDLLKLDKILKTVNFDLLYLFCTYVQKEEKK